MGRNRAYPLDEQTYKMLKRIKETEDGKEFINLLNNMSKNNYKAWKHTTDSNDIFKGQAICLDGLIELFTNCEQKLTVNKPNDTEWL